MEKITVNKAHWTEQPDTPIPDGWLIANAPRPLCGRITWTGQFRHGIFYAASPPDLPTRSWEIDDAWLIEFTSNDQLMPLIIGKLAEYGYTSLDDAGLTVVEVASMMNLPWHEGDADA